MIAEAQRSKPLPAYLHITPRVGKGAAVESGIGKGVKNMGSQFENWEIEKKYKRNIEALKKEIEEKYNEILLKNKEVANVNQRVVRLEKEKQELENKLIDKHAKPPRQMQADSENFGNIEEIQKLKDEIFHLQ